MRRLSKLKKIVIILLSFLINISIYTNNAKNTNNSQVTSIKIVNFDDNKVYQHIGSKFCQDYSDVNSFGTTLASGLGVSQPINNSIKNTIPIMPTIPNHSFPCPKTALKYSMISGLWSSVIVWKVSGNIRALLSTLTLLKIKNWATRFLVYLNQNGIR